MKLTPFLLYYFIHDEYNWDFDEDDAYPFEVTDEDFKVTEIGQFGYTYYPKLNEKADAWFREHNVEVVSEEITDYDLEKAYVTKRVVFSYDDKYYVFHYDYSYYWDDDDPLDRELKEVHPKEKTITIYE